MVLTDFEYDGQRLSSWGCVPCSFESLESTVSTGNELELNTVKPPRSNQNRIISTGYGTNFELVMYLCKGTCPEPETFYFSESEVNSLLRWLNRRTYCKFKPIYNDGSFSNVFYNATFNVKLISAAGNVIGLELTMITDSPYAYQETRTVTFPNARMFQWSDTSDEIGTIPCDVQITCHEAGDLVITNSLDQINPVKIQNVQVGEVITLKGKTKMITSSTNHPKLYNDFNYGFIRMANTYSNRANVFNSSLSITITISYNPIRKVGMV